MTSKPTRVPARQYPDSGWGHTDTAGVAPAPAPSGPWQPSW
jgi:hypothetical protein